MVQTRGKDLIRRHPDLALPPRWRVNGGFGVRLYAGKRWGIEPELKVIRYTGDLGFTAVRYRAGVFFEFGK
jgi:hypothetical protein